MTVGDRISQPNRTIATDIRTGDGGIRHPADDSASMARKNDEEYANVSCDNMKYDLNV